MVIIWVLKMFFCSVLRIRWPKYWSFSFSQAMQEKKALSSRGRGKGASENPPTGTMSPGWVPLAHAIHDSDNHDGVITDLEPDILECEVKWALESITINIVSNFLVRPASS